MLKDKIIKTEDLEKVLNLEKEIVANLKNKDLYISSTEEDFKKFIKQTETIFLGTFDGEELIAYCVYNLNCNKFNEIFKKYKIIHSEKSSDFDGVAVHPSYRGKGIHKKYIDYFVDCSKENNIEEIYATVHPDNIPSLKNFLKKGFIKIEEILKRGKYKRILLRKKIK